MSGSSFVHLHNHTEYSLLDGMAKIDMLAEEVARQGMPAVAMTDHGNMFGSDHFYRTVTAAGVKPIIGIEAYIAPESRFNKGSVFWGQPEQKKDDVANAGKYLHQTMLAENATGLRNLFYLSSKASFEGTVGKHYRMDQELIASRAEGLIATTGCPSGDVQTRLRLGQFDKALEAAATWQDIYGKDNYFLELMDHGLDIERRVREDLMEIGRRLDLPPLVTNDCHYVLKEQAPVHEIMLCVGTGSTLAEPTLDQGGRRFAFSGDNYYIRSAEDMRAQWDAEVPKGCDNTLWIAERVQDYGDVWAEHPYDRMPIADVPEGETPTSWLTKEVMRGLEERFPGEPVPAEYIDRAKYEIDVIDGKGYPSYFLIVAELIGFARSEGIHVGPGRGSAAGSLVAYALKITNIDPMEHGLLFERFLNPERPSAPDIDIDFDDRGRERVIDFAVERWGEDKVSQVITFGTVKTKQALKDAARAHYGTEGYRIAERITNVLPAPIMAKDIPLSGIMDPDHERYVEATEVRNVIEGDAELQKIYKDALGLEGVIRQTSVHACAVIMSSVPLLDCIPMKKDEDGLVITGWPYPACEAIGLLKMDFLGLRNLTVIGDALEALRDDRGIEVDLDTLSTEDTATYEMLARGETLGVFQLDSEGMQKLLKRMQPTGFNDIVAALALYRPGPMGVNAHNDYADRKNGRKPVTPIHPELEEALFDILDETYGLIVYQEQIMRISQKVANYTAGQADGFRKAMGKKKPEVLEKEFVTFESGMKSNGYSKDAIETLWNTILPFAGYAFNKSHAAGYGLVSFWTAYLKANYTAEYMAALLSSVAGNGDRRAMYLSDCRHLGIQVLSPDVNESIGHFRAVNGDIRFGLSSIKNVGEAVVESIVATREKVGPFRDFSDYLNKIDLIAANKRVTESLIKAGAFDSMGLPRKGLCLVQENAVDSVVNTKKAAERGQFDLFASFGEEGQGTEETDSVFEVEVPDQEWEKKQKLALEREMLGLYVSEHPLDGFESALDSQIDTSLTAIAAREVRNRADVIVGGLIVDIERRTDRNGNPWARVTIEDQNGAQAQLLVFAKTYQLVSPQLVMDNIILAKASTKVDDDGGISLFCNDVKPADLTQGAGTGVPLRIRIQTHQTTPENLERLKRVLKQNPGDSDVYLTLVNGEEEIQYMLPPELRVNKNSGLMGSLKAGTWGGIFG